MIILPSSWKKELFFKLWTIVIRSPEGKAAKKIQISPSCFPPPSLIEPNNNHKFFWSGFTNFFFMMLPIVITNWRIHYWSHIKNYETWFFLTSPPFRRKFCTFRTLYLPTKIMHWVSRNAPFELLYSKLNHFSRKGPNKIAKKEYKYGWSKFGLNIFLILCKSIDKDFYFRYFSSSSAL